MSKQANITGLWSYIRAVLLKPAWDFYTVGGLFTFLFVTTWWRDNFASDEMKKRWELRGLLPHWSGALWVAIFFSILLSMVLRRSYALVCELDVQLEELNAIPVPEFVIDIAREGDDVIGFKLKNTSQKHLYDLGVANIDSRAGEIGWWENHFNLLEANGGEKILKPSSRLTGITRFRDVTQLRDALNSQPGATNPEFVGDIRVRACDADGVYYIFKARLEFWNMYTWHIWETQRSRRELTT